MGLFLVKHVTSRRSMYWANAVSVAIRLQTVHTERTGLFITHVQTVTPINNTLKNTTGLFLAHVKTVPPR